MYSILYVDDEPGLLDICKLFLESGGQFRVDTVTSAEEAIRLTGSNDYDAIISDYQMPEMDGIEFLKAVRGRGDTTPFILFTGRGREEVVIDAINNGADFYLQKGGDVTAQFAELAHKIRQAVNRKRTEEALVDSEKRFRELADLLPQGIYEADIDGRITYVNYHALEMFGYTEEDFKNGLNTMAMIAPGDRPKAIHAFRMMADEGAVPRSSAEYLAQRKDGSTFDVAIFSSPVIRNNRIAGVRGILMNITEQKRTDDELRAAHEQLLASDEELRAQFNELVQGEQRIRESESRLRSFIETTQESVTLVDEEGKVIEWNAATERITGLQKEEVLGTYLWDLTFRMLPPEQRTEERRALIEQRIRTSLKTGIPVFGEPRVIESEGPGGSRIYTRQTIFPIRTGKGFGIGSISQDITRERLAELALMESEKKYHDLADLLPQMVFELDLEFRVIWANQHALATIGLTPQDIEAGINARSFIVPADLKIAEDDIKKILGGMSLGAREFTAVRKDNSTFPVLMYAAPVYRNNELCGFRGVAVDITERKTMEDALKKSEEKFRGMAERSSDLILVLNKEMSPVFVSPSVQPLLGFAPDELVGKMPEFALATIFSGTGPALENAVKATMSGLPVDNVELQLTRKDKSPVIVSLSAVPVLREGRVAGAQVSMRDITEQVATQSALQAVIGSMVGTTGITSLQQIVETVSSWLDVDCVMIGEIQPDHDTVKVLAMVLDGKQVNDFIYHLKGTPCENVTEKGFCHYPENSVRLFPYAKDITDLNIQGYAGTPLRNSRGKVVGILCVLSRMPLRLSPSVKMILDTIATKAGAEIERSQIERELQKSEEKFRSFVENANEIIFSLTPDGIFTYVSPNWTEWLGHDPGEVIGKPAADFIHPDDFPHNREVFLTTLTKGKRMSGAEFRVRHKDGSWRWNSQSISPIRNAEGTIMGIQGISHDITDRKLAEAELQKSRYLLSEALDMARMAKWEADPLTGVFTFNDQFYALYGTTAEREGGYQMAAEVYAREFTHPDDRHMVAEEIVKALSTPDPGYFSIREHRIIRRDGEVRWITVRIRVEKDAQGRTIRTHGANQDITDRKRMEEALARSEEKYRILAEESPDQIFINSRDGRILYANTAALKAFHGSYDQVVGKSRKNLFPPHINKKFEEKTRIVFDRGEPVHAEDEIQVGDEKLWIDTSLVPLKDPSGTVTSILGIARDITRRKQMEEAIRKANKKLNLLSSITRHDISNQLLALNGFLSLLQKEVDGTSSEKYFSRITQASSNIAEMILFTKEYEKIGTGDPVWQDLTTAIALAGKDIIPGQFTLKTDLPAAMEVYADPMLERVFFNLLDNAVRHGEHVTQVHVSSRREGGNLVIVWEDDGVGIAAEHKERIFERDFGKNTGLGMFLVREILSLTGISIVENGEAGKGARFEITVPAGSWRIVGT